MNMTTGRFQSRELIDRVNGLSKQFEKVLSQIIALLTRIKSFQCVHAQFGKQK